MKSLEYIIENYKSETLDGRDLNRLAKFIKEEDLSKLGLELKEERKGTHEPIPYNRENVLAELKKDLEFAFEKALNKRVISASLMHDVICMWNWILEEGLEDMDDYMWYGLPTLKATALKYNLDNPIGDDEGTEGEYGD